MKLEDIRSENGKAYFRFWRKGLSALLGWPDERIEQWAEKFKDCIHDENNLLFHALPGTYIAGEYLNERFPGWWNELARAGLWTANSEREISDCINEFIYPELTKGQGWDNARARIDEAVKRMTIPKLEP